MGTVKEVGQKSTRWLEMMISMLSLASIGGAGAYLAIRRLENGLGDFGLGLIWISISVFAAFYVQMIAHEFGHYLFGKLSGYQLVSFTIGSLMFIKTNDHKIKLKRYAIPGAAGQCLMNPPDTEDPPYKLYNFGGIILNFGLGMLCLVLYWQLPVVALLSEFLLFNFVVGISLAIMNGVPLRINGIANDGYNILAMKKSAATRRVFWIVLRINYSLQSGMRYRDMPAEWFELPNDLDLENHLASAMIYTRGAYFRDQHQFEHAKQEYQTLLVQKGALEFYKLEARCELLFYELVGECRAEEVERLYTKALKKHIARTEKFFIERQRLLFAYQLLFKKNSAAAKVHLELFEKMSAVYPYFAAIQLERELLQLVNHQWEMRK